MGRLGVAEILVVLGCTFKGGRKSIDEGFRKRTKGNLKHVKTLLWVKERRQINKRLFHNSKAFFSSV
jgi:hypothetical protein